MTTFVIAASLLTLLTLVLLLWPLVRRQREAAPERARYDLAVYRDQLEEVERDVRRGVLGESEAEAARVEVKRRMLGAAAADSVAARHAEEPPKGPRSALRQSIRAAAVLSLLVPLGAAVLYVELGAPDTPDQPLAERGSELAAGGDRPASLEEAAERLAKRLEANPRDAGGWYLLGRAYLAMRRPSDAVSALAHAMALAPDELDVLGAYTEARLATSDGQVDDETRAALQKMLTLDPTSPQARFLLALDQAQQGDLPGAMQGWVDMIAMAPADARWLPTVRQHLQQAAEASGIDPASLHPSAEALALAEQLRAAERAEADATTAGVANEQAREAAQGQGAETGSGAAPPGPSAADVAAAGQMSSEERAQMIRGMVDRLAARLQETPDDIDGWRRLARAYDVLGETEKAADARKRIAALEGR